MSERQLLLVSDAFLDYGSGASAAREAAGAWTRLGFRVTALSSPGSTSEATARRHPYEFVPLPQVRTIEHIFGGRAVETFRRVLQERNPEVVFFLGSSYSKPIPMLRAARRSGALTMFMLWNQDFYCAKSYAWRDDKPCVLCGRGNPAAAFRYRCSGFNTLAAGALVRPSLRTSLKSFDVLLCSSDEQRARLRDFTSTDEAIVDCPLFFDRDRLNGLSAAEDDYFLFYGQAVEPKGWHLLERIIRACPETRFLLCPSGLRDLSGNAKETLLRLEREDRVSVKRGPTWFDGLGELVARARGVLIPSVWPTTTEYVLLESLGLEKPVVAFSVGVNSERLTHRISAMLAPSGDAELFGAHVRELDRDEGLRRAVGAEGRLLFRKWTDPALVDQALLAALMQAEALRAES